MAADASGAPPFVAHYSLTEDEERDYGRVLAARQYAAAGHDLAWYSYLCAIPVGLAGGFIAVALGLDGRELGATVAMLIGVGYMAGYYASYFTSRLYQARLAAAFRREVPGYLEGMSITIDGDGVTSRWRRSHSFLAWEDMTGLTRERGLLIFWIGPSRGAFVPRRALAEGDETGIVSLASERIGRKT